MSQETTVEPVEFFVVRSSADDAVVVCRNCGHLVPKTMMCLYCGSPILFRKPRKM